MNNKSLLFWTLICAFLAVKPMQAQDHPNLILTSEGVAKIRTHLGKVPTFDRYLNEVKAKVDAEIQEGVFVPIPKDMAGGYTHEPHKRNFLSFKKQLCCIKF